MGYLLKEGLKTLCGVNQWSYAVFWKIGCQNPKLLIWEECYYENSDAALDDFNASWISPEASNARGGNKVHLLVNKMMMDSHVNIVGEGLVGRVAFTGNHQWILSGNYRGDSHPPEVVKEVCQQFSAGMQTVAVIPVLPHGVVQFGSSMAIKENMGFINDVTSLILQLGYVSGALLSPSYEPKEHPPRTGNCASGGSSLESNVFSFDSFNCVGPNSVNVRQQDYQFINGVAKAEVIPSNQSTILHAPRRSAPPQNEKLHKVEPSISNSADCFTSNSSLAYSSDAKLHHLGRSKFKTEMGQTTLQDQSHDIGGEIPYVNSSSYDELCVLPESGDDLFDVLGADFKNKLFSSCWNSPLSNESAPNIQSWENKSNPTPKKSLASSELYSSSHGNSESGVFSSDHLLEAVVSKVQPCNKQSADETLSCRTTLTNTSSASTPNTTLPYGRFGISDQLKGELFGVPKYLGKVGGAMSSCSKEESRSYSQGSSIYGSQISSWMEKDQKARPSNSVSTGHSKKPDETGKSNRKRLKPGESPRPRPKDRQMIQDRVKELREIVPNGAKCSIDALLERTIKHMLFLQSVTKHADKLKQTGESKIISKDGGLLLKDNFEGGATWAYEVGSQSMVCPIIVEDLNQPRQMLVEMLCEERGLFLEIADIIRGLGLTILKGVMETKNDKIWARFAVEANRDVTRMEIFISLVRLLEQSSKGGAPQQKDTSNDNLKPQQQFHSTARSRSVQ